MNNSLWVCLFLITILIGSCKGNRDQYIWKSLKVNVFAYNSHISQTDSLPNLAAWGDTLRPGMKCIAVSQDLLALGLGHNTVIKIQGLNGIYLVKDKMHPSKRNSIDIYMGNDIKAARAWGRQRLTIEYQVKKDSLMNYSK